MLLGQGFRPTLKGPMMRTTMLWLAPIVTLLAASAPQPHVYEVVRYGAKCDAVTTGPIHTTLVQPAALGTESVRLASVANVVRGAQIYLNPATSTQEVRYVRGVSGMDVAFTEPLKLDHPAAAPVYGDGGYVAGTDDTAAINRAFAAAAHEGEATVLFPGPGGTSTGKCAISGPLNASTSGLTVAGAGMHTTTIVAMPNFDYDPANTPRGLDNQYVGMLWTDRPEPPPAGHRLSLPEPPLQHVTIRDLGLDPRAGTQSHFYKFQAITGYVRAMQYFTVRNVYFDLGSPLSFTDLVKPFTGVNYISLSYDPANASHDLVFENNEIHNGVGSTMLRQGGGASQSPCPPVVHDKISAIRIVNQRDMVDLNDIEDDRIVITANGCHPGAEIDDIQVSGQVVSIAPSVTTGGVNGLKIEALNAVMRNVQYTDAQYTGSPNGPYLRNDRLGSGSAFAALIFNQDSGISNLSITHLRASNSMGVGLGLRGGPAGEPVHTILDDISLLNSYGQLCLRFAGNAQPTGNDVLHVSNVTCSASPEARARFGASLIGAYFLPSGVPTNGVSGDVVVQNSRFLGYAQPIYIYGGGGFRGVVLDGVSWDTGHPVVDRSTIFRNTSGARAQL
jgi:hypothetical protein